MKTLDVSKALEEGTVSKSKNDFYWLSLHETHQSAELQNCTRGTKIGSFAITFTSASFKNTHKNCTVWQFIKYKAKKRPKVPQRGLSQFTHAHRIMHYSQRQWHRILGLGGGITLKLACLP